MRNRVSYNPLNGRFTLMDVCRSYEDAKPQEHSNHWSCTEYNSNGAWYVYFYNGNVNNNNKYNSLTVRPVAAFDGLSGGFAPFLSSVWQAYGDCLRNKRTSPQAVEYIPTAREDVPRLAREIWEGRYAPSTSTCFMVKYPKYREVFAASFRDRIVHHWIAIRLNPMFEERFVSQGNVSLNCRRGFGTNAAVEKVAEGMKKVSHNYTNTAWAFKGDFAGFFMSINKKVLWNALRKLIVRDRRKMSDSKGMYWDILLEVTRITVMHHPESDCVLNSPICMWKHLPKEKSLFNREDGEPIGNLTTQLFANYLLSFFDNYVAHVYRGKNYSYTRFVDDFCIICDDKGFVLESLERLGDYASRYLKLNLHKDKRYLQPVSHGIGFVGSYIKPHRIYLSNRTLARFEERAEGFLRMMEDREPNSLDRDRMECVLNSYLGFCKGRRTYRRRKSILDKLMRGGMGEYFYIKGNYKSVRIKSKYRHKTW